MAWTWAMSLERKQIWQEIQFWCPMELTYKLQYCSCHENISHLGNETQNCFPIMPLGFFPLRRMANAMHIFRLHYYVQENVILSCLSSYNYLPKRTVWINWMFIHDFDCPDCTYVNLETSHWNMIHILLHIWNQCQWPTPFITQG